MILNRAESKTLIKISQKTSLQGQKNNQYLEVMLLKGLLKDKIKDSSILRMKNKKRKIKVATILLILPHQKNTMSRAIRKKIYTRETTLKWRRVQILKPLMTTNLERLLRSFKE